MESTHDLDFVLWCLEPAKPVRVYSQVNYGAMRESTGSDIPDLQWITVTMDSGLTFVVGGGWSLPPGYPRSEELTSELQSHLNLVCRLLLEKKKKIKRSRIQNADE